MTTRHPTQIGGSQRGPGALDTGKEHRGLPDEDLTVDDEAARALPSGETAEESEEAARGRKARAPGLGGSEGRRPGETPVHTADEDAEAEASRSAQPGGDRASESERPDSPRSRWGAGPEGER
jgi:hypothetical protein